MQGNGRYLAASLHRIMQSDDGAEAEMSHWVRQVIPGARWIRVRHLEELHRYVVDLETRDGQHFTSRVLSDGTLRLLALLALQYDPEPAGVIFLEEPENGVHPRRLFTIVDLLKGMSTNPEAESIDPQESLRQVLINTHSPYLVDALDLDDLILVEESTLLGGNGAVPRRHTAYRPVLTSSPGPLFAAQSAEPTRRHIKELLEGQELGSLWASGAIGGVP